MKISIVAALLSLLFLFHPAQAGYLNGFIGNVKGATSGGSGQITGNFAVLDRLAGGTPGDVFGTGMPGFDNLFVSGGGSASFDTSARYLYLGQRVVSPTSTDFGGLFAGGPGAQFGSVTSFEQWNLYLTDDKGIVSLTNDFGLDGQPFTETAAANFGVTTPSLTSNGSGSSLIGVAGVTNTATTISGTFVPTLSAGQTSRITGYTSNLPPGFIIVGSTPSFAGSAELVPVPEPSETWLLVIGGGCLGFAIRLRPIFTIRRWCGGRTEPILLRRAASKRGAGSSRLSSAVLRSQFRSIRRNQ